MVSRWFDFKRISSEKLQTLRSLAVGFVCFAVLYIAAKIFDGTLCPFKRIFGIPCFGCGLTRGFTAILDLDFRGASEYHVLSLPLFAAIALYTILAFVDVIFNTTFIVKTERKMSRPYMFLIYFLILIGSYILNH